MKKLAWLPAAVWLLLSVLACNLSVSIESSTSAPTPTLINSTQPPLEAPTLAPPPPNTESPTSSSNTALAPTEASTAEIELGNGLRLVSKKFKEEGQAPPFGVEVNIPALAGETSPRVDTFNRAVEELIGPDLAGFKDRLKDLLAPQVLVIFHINYTVALANSEIVSITFEESGYYPSAAHPFVTYFTLNYSLVQSRILTLAELFIPGLPYLDVISNYVIHVLQKRDMFFPHAAAPTETNYKNWNITPDGLLLTFDQGTVMAYASGPQSVVVPYGELREYIDPNGPLASVVK